MGLAVSGTVGPKPRRMADFVAFFCTVVGYWGFIDQTSPRAVRVEATDAVQAHHIAFIVTSVISEFLIILRNTEHCAVLAIPPRQTRFTSVLCTTVMSAVVITRDALCATVRTKPRW